MNQPHSAEARRLCDDGYALLEAGRFVDARTALERARALEPDAPLIHFRLALLFVDIGEPATALASLDRSLELESSNARAHNNRGSALQMLGRLGDAELAFRKAMELDPGLEQPYLNIGHLLEKRGRQNEAVALYELAIARGLNPQGFEHHRAAAMGQSADRAPDLWVRATFDNFAPTFDSRLRALGYDAPLRLAARLRESLSGPIDMLDLGCGTGQCGVALADCKRTLVGVDLSQKMLTQARIRGIYDELHLADIETFLRDVGSARFDVIMAADVFVYIGDLTKLFVEVARTLRPGGWFAFTTEEIEDQDYALLASGRFAQSRGYIERLATGAFSIVMADSAVIRTESVKPLQGRLYLLRRSGV